MTNVPQPLAAAGDSGFLALILTLSILIMAAKLVGSLSVQLGQPAVLGELVAGLVLGPSVLNVLQISPLQAEGVGAAVHQLGQIGVLWLMFAAGLELDLNDMRQAGRPATLAGVFGVLVPVVLGVGVGLAFDYPIVPAVFLGITLSATSVSISAQTLLELGRLRSREGIALLGAAVIDDVLVIIILSMFVAIVGGGADAGALGAQLFRLLGSLVLVGLMAVVLLPRFADLAQRLRASEGVLASVLAAVLLLAWLIEYVGGVAAITGAFLAGLGLSRSHLRHEIEQGLHRLAYGFFVPLFLVDIGLQADLRSLDPDSVVFALVLIVVAVLSKVIGSGAGALLGGFDRQVALRMGLGMVSRGEVGLIVAGVGVTNELLQPEMFSLIVLMVLATTLLTPPMLRAAFSRQEVNDGPTGRVDIA